MGEKARIWSLISKTAERQHGHVTRAQLLGMGMGRGAISYALHSGDLVRIHAGVYAVGYRRVEPVARAAAAVLACGERAVLSHDSAAALWGLRRWPRTPEVTCTRDRRPPAVRTHLSTTLTPADVRVQLNIRATSPARTIADVAPRLSDRQLTRAVQDARHKDQLKPTALQDLLRRCPRVRTLVDPTQNPTRSTLEDDFLRWIRRHKLPMPTINIKSGGMEVDALFETERVIVELDSWKYHGDPITFRSDAERGTAQAANGCLPLRLTSDRFTDREAERLHEILARRR